MRGAGELSRKMCSSTSTEATGARNDAVRELFGDYPIELISTSV